MTRIGVVIPAAGSGVRFGSRTPKQFLRLGGGSILAVTVAHFLRYPGLVSTIVVVPEGYLGRACREVASMGRRGRPVVVSGGPTRQESVRIGLEAVSGDVDVVVVHDGVRPLITRRLLDAVVRAATESGAAICALPITETVKRVRDGFVAATLDRSDLWAVQTPQAYRTAVLREAHARARRDGVTGTDDAMLVERLGHAVRVVPGLPTNVKITIPADLRRVRGAVLR